MFLAVRFYISSFVPVIKCLKSNFEKNRKGTETKEVSYDTVITFHYFISCLNALSMLCEMWYELGRFLFIVNIAKVCWCVVIW